MAASLIFMAGFLAAPVVDDDFSRRVAAFMPQWALNERQQVAYMAEFRVLPDGRVASCLVLEFAGSERLATESCAATVGLKLHAATDSEGKPVHGILRHAVKIFVDGGRDARAVRAFAMQPDLELSVSQLPADTAQLDLQIVFTVAPDGQVTECEDRKPDNEPAPARYVAAACEQARSLRGVILRDASGAALPYVTNLRVRFSKDLAPTDG